MKTLRYFFVPLIAILAAQCSPKVGDQVSTPKPTTPAVTDFRAQAPAAGEARKIEIGDYESFVLDNGLRVIVVENHKIPRVSYQLFIDRGPVQEGELAGLSSLAGSLLSRGTTTRTKAQIDEEVDFVGGSVSSSAQGGFASGLTRHSETVLSVFADVMLNPSFPEEEFEKLKFQTISGLQSQKDSPDAISANVSGAMVYGKDHPYGEITTEQTVTNTTVDDCRNYYRKYFVPNNTYLVVVGDITTAKAKKQAETYFGKWARGEAQKQTFPVPAAPEKTQVHFVDKAGAVQSVVNITYPVDLHPASPDVIPSRVMNTILGSGFSGRLFRNLREDKAYTYGAYSSLNTDEVVGRFSASASVRNVVTDSAVTEFLYELNTIRNEEVTDSELELAKNFIAGNFARSLESPETVASFALNTFRYNLPQDYYATYLERLQKVTKADVLAMARKYVRPDKAHIVVVGNQDEVSQKLGVFDQMDGKVDYYDIYANKKPDAPAAEITVSGKDVVAAYIKAIGGEATVRAVTSLVMESTMNVPGMGEMTVSTKQMAPNKLSMTMGMTGMTLMRQVFDGEKGYAEQMGQRQMIEGDDLNRMKNEAMIFEELEYFNDAYTLEVKGVDEIRGEQAYRVVVNGPGGASTHYFSVASGLKLRSVKLDPQSGDTATTDYGDYREVNGVKVPHTSTITGMAPFPLEMKATLVEVNAAIDPSVFSVE